MKIWKAKNNYGLELKEILFDDMFWGGIDEKLTPVRNLPVHAKFLRHYELLEQEELGNPLLLFSNYKNKNKIWNGCLRMRVAIERGYDGIDCVVSDDLDLLKRLTIVQQSDAQNYFSVNALESLESIHLPNGIK